VIFKKNCIQLCIAVSRGGVIFFLAKRILFYIFVYDFNAFGYAFTRPNGNAERCMQFASAEGIGKAFGSDKIKPLGINGSRKK
jgi:hypothetical protein